MNRLDRLLSTAVALLATAHVAAAQPVAGRGQPPLSPRAEAVTARAVLGSLSGFVSDDRGVPLEGVMVSATGTTVAFAVTDPVGKYTFDRLPSGGYLLRAHLTGFVASRREFVEIRASMGTVRLIQLRRAADAAVGTTGVPPRSIMTAGVSLPGSSQAGPSEGSDPAAGTHPHDERAWRLRHLKRTALKEESGAVVAETASADFAASESIASFFAGFPFTGELNLLTTGVFDSAAELFTGERAPRGVAYLAIGAPAGLGDWTVRAALTQGDVSSWILSGSYIARGTRTHAFDLGMSYGAQQYKDGNPAALALASDGNRHVGALYAFDDWAVSRRMQLSYGARLSYYDYLDRDGLWSPRVGISVMPIERTWVRAVVSQRQLAPGAEEFLPPPSQTMWLPPERTFAPLVGDTFLVERARHLEVSVEREFADAYIVGVRRFYQNVDDQLVTLFGLHAEGRPRSELGHYFVANAGGFDADGWGVRLASPLAARLRGSVDYTLTRARWSTAGDADAIERWSPSARREREEFHDVTTAVETEIPETATRVFVLYRINTAYARPEAEVVRPGLDARFDVQVKQALPFLPFGSQWEVLVGVRNLFREPMDVASVYDELLVVRPPKRLVGGVQVKF
ncbi:MAG: TonB-dependent receptor domain-containing protein [Vicinamibacterales bacterium]